MISILQGDWIEVLKTLPEKSVQCCVTSPPYWGLRDYGVAGQLGLEKTPEEYVSEVVAGFHEVRRVLRDDGTLWLNLGDSYAGSGKARGGGGCGPTSSKQVTNGGSYFEIEQEQETPGIKPKDLVGIPWMVAFALRADGWYLRSDIIWHKPNPMPESVTDRPTKAHEYIFLLSKQVRYYYDSDAIKEPSIVEPHAAGYVNGNEYAVGPMDRNGHSQRQGDQTRVWASDGRRNKRSVWRIATSPYSEAHFATFPPKLIEPCILAGSKVGDTILDPFGGSGTTGMVSEENGRNSILIELNPKYIELAQKRTKFTVPIPKQKTLWDIQNCSAV